MMDDGKWKRLEETFNNEELFWEQNWVDYSELDFNIMDWLDCSTTSPSWKMMDEFKEHGYKVVCHERDSFGWLVGGVKQVRTGKEIVFG